MGAYLSSPICEKDTIEGSNNRLAFAASSMQGWRMSQEDSHNAILDFDDKTSLFAVYDGHGGAEIALYCSRHLPDFIKQLDSYRQGQLTDALIEGFLKFDSLLLEPNVKEILQELVDSKDKNDNDDEQIDDQSHDIVLPTNTNEENITNDELNVEEAQLLKKEAELPIEELLKRYGEDGKHFHSPMITKRIKQNPIINDDEKIKNLQKLKELRNSEETNEDNVVTSSIDSEEIKTDVVTHTDEENTLEDDVLDHKIAETTGNGEISYATEPKPSSSEPKTTSRRPRKPPSTDTTITTTVKSKSLTHHLLNDNMDELEDDEEEDEDDFELDESEGETSDDENAGDEDDDDEVETTEEEDDEEDKPLEPSKAAQIKKLMRKSIMAILNRHPKKTKQNDDSEDDAKENQNDEEGGEEEEEEGDEEEDDDEGIDDENDADLGKMLDMNSDPGSSSGCTAVVTILRDKQLFVANAGDSRCIICRGGRAIEMSIDHKPEDPQERTRIEKAGYKVTLDGRVSGGLNLSRAIGDHAYKKTVALPAEEQAITALPDVRTLTLEDQDEFMVIACDGIWNFMSSQDVVDFVRIRIEKKTLAQICEELFMHCLAPNTSGDGTGCDNMTAIIVNFKFNQQLIKKTNEESVVSKSIEHSPWPTMFSPVNNKRSLSPENTSTTEIVDNNTSKKLKIVAENGTNEITSPSKTTGSFSFNTASNNINNSNDDQQL